MHRLSKIFFFLAMALASVSIVIPEKYNDSFAIFENEKDAKAILEGMNLDEKIGQIFMVPVYSDRSSFHKKEILELIEKQHIGGVIFMKGHPYKQYKWTQEFNTKSKQPLLVAMDAEWGLSMRLDSVIKYPKQMTMGALQHNELIRAFAGNVAKQMQLLGTNVSFSPVVDINSNPQNPVIHMRSFGESKYDVADKAIQYLVGLQENGVLAVAKHFPGHGDTYVDSHLDLPLIETSKRRLGKVELYPFSRLFEAGVAGTMTAHLKVPAFMGSDKGPASLSNKITEKLLRKNMGFEGLVFSDALNMQGVTKYVPEDEIDISAFYAGNDILLFPSNIVLAKEKIKEAIEKGKIDIEDLNARVLRILESKLWIASKKQKTEEILSAKELHAKLNLGAHKLVNHQMAEGAITILGNGKTKQFKTLNDTVLVVTIGSPAETVFEQTLANYSPIKVIRLAEDGQNFDEKSILKQAKNATKLVFALHNVNPYKLSTNFGYNPQVFSSLNRLLETKKNAILVNFGSPYMLLNLTATNTIYQAYEELNEIQSAVAQALYGAVEISGSLPVSAMYSFGQGENFEKKNLLSYGLPEQVGLHTENLNRIDAIAQKAIAEGAMPGCQVLVAKDGKVVYQKAFGNFTYEANTPVNNNNLYDVASMTKVMASTLMVMRFYEMGEIDLDKTLNDYLGSFVDKSKTDLSLREILTHQSGLSAWIPFYKYTLTEGGMCDTNYCYEPNSFFKLKVADNLFVQEGIKDTIYKLINKSEMKVRGKYLYSDLGYFYILKILKNINNQQFEDYLYANFYQSLGMYHTLYNPLDVYAKNDIVPTENDNYFRHQLVHGYVHDPAAAMFGGIAGHAGIFSTTNDVAKLFQMFLQNGSYNGTNYLEAETIKLFTNKQYTNNRKGIGFDKPETRPGVPSPVNIDVSPATFGHTGFTGTCVWADPAYNLTFVFLSNRVYPTAENMKLITMNVRTNILQVVYDDLLDKIP